MTYGRRFELWRRLQHLLSASAGAGATSQQSTMFVYVYLSSPLLRRQASLVLVVHCQSVSSSQSNVMAGSSQGERPHQVGRDGWAEFIEPPDPCSVRGKDHNDGFRCTGRNSTSPHICTEACVKRNLIEIANTLGVGNGVFGGRREVGMWNNRGGEAQGRRGSVFNCGWVLDVVGLLTSGISALLPPLILSL